MGRMRERLVLLVVAVAMLATASSAGATVADEWDGTALPAGNQYFRPVGIGISGGNIYVGDTDRAGTAGPLHPRVVEFDPDGAYLGEWATAYSPGAIATDLLGKLYVAP